MDLFWAKTEWSAGRYDFSAYDRLVRDLKSTGMRPLFILDYSNPIYRPAGIAPDNPESRTAFARWAAAAAKHFPNTIWEIWNEPNHYFWRPWPDVNEYLPLAIQTAEAIHRVDKTATVISPGTLHFDWKFIGRVIHSSLIGKIDAFSVHPYLKVPEKALPEYARLKRMLWWRSPFRKIPIVCSEWGASSYVGGATEEEQANLLKRQHLVNLAAGVKLSIWYDWRDDGTDPKEREHHFGLIDRKGRYKPAYYAMKEINRELSGYRFERRISLGNRQDFLFLFINDRKERKAVAWTIGSPHPAKSKYFPSSFILTGKPKFLPLPTTRNRRTSSFRSKETRADGRSRICTCQGGSRPFPIQFLISHSTFC